MPRDYKRRDLLRTIGAAGLGSLAGCASTLGAQASEIDSQLERTEGQLPNSVNWNKYPLSYETGSISIGKDDLGPTGVENAHTYAIYTEFDLADASDDLSGWMATSERRGEFFSLLNRTTYDVLDTVSDDFESFHPDNQPSHKNQVVQYGIRVNADGCSYVEDPSIPTERIDDILASRAAYNQYVANGQDYNIHLEGAPLGLEQLCGLD